MSTTDAYMVVKDGETEFRWHGGAYIDVGYTQAMGEAGIDGDDFHAYDCINVWDYETNEPRIERTLDALKARVAQYIAEQDEDES